MKLASHELNILSELSMSCVNSITNMAYMLQHVQDPQLKSILEKHFPLHVRDYNMKVEFLHQASGAGQELPLLKEVGQLNDYTQSGCSQYPTVQPRTLIDNFDDREIATAYLLTLKRAGREYAWMAMEAANPELRSFLQTAFMMSCSHAYDVWQYMVSKGYYPLEAAQSDTIGKVGGMYRVVPEDQPQIQQYLNRYQNPMMSRSGQLYQ
jgi:spore coat protein CotF